ncbi:insulin-like growth factor-binding protein 7 [Homarus americanus]|uniref:Uncharacterized protein n=1 Tax=Homarus americanus TaxID=6706 RepID=A0A8J5K4C9_HOMAM|nr:insulin-like growth factor-binding protein 7 [Homarus americanus]KAG7164679.1 hypothetical protein Hamer_G005069 [Homarus americanus]
MKSCIILLVFSLAACVLSEPSPHHIPGHKCNPCVPADCKPVTPCAFGITKDTCDCCDICRTKFRDSHAHCHDPHAEDHAEFDHHHTEHEEYCREQGHRP